MCPRPARAGLLCLTLLGVLAPAALPPRRAAAAATAFPAVSARPAGLEWGRGAAGPGDLPLGWATYLGGHGADHGSAITADNQGNIYATGDTDSPDFPITPGAAQPHLAGIEDAFVAAYDARGRVRWVSYLGGSSVDVGSGIAVDGRGNVYATGDTASPDFLAIPGAAQPHPGGRGDAFVASYDPRGRLRWATYLGGTSEDHGAGIAVEGQGNVYVTGATDSADDFPLTRGAPPLNPGVDHVFVASYDGQGHRRWATDLGGSYNDLSYAIAADGQGNVYVSGDTDSPDFPLTSGAAQSGYGGSEDAFVASYDARGRPRWATYLGGSDLESGQGIAADGQGNIYVSGITRSDDLPVTPGAAQPRIGGVEDAFLASYDADGQLRWATYLGGQGDERGNAIAAGAQGAVYATGFTDSPDFPITPGAAQPVLAGRRATDTFVARLVAPASPPAALYPASAPPAGTPHARFFPQTRHTLAGPFLATWDRLGGIPALGLPLSEPFTLAGQRVQVTERAVLVRSGGQVSLLPLGPLLSAARAFAPVAPVSGTATRLYFPSTGHTLAGPFLAYWQAHQGSALLGSPISEPDREGTGDGTGRVYLVQWFANGRLELHPEIKDARYRVEQGRVGYEYLHRLGLL